MSDALIKQFKKAVITFYVSDLEESIAVSPSSKYAAEELERFQKKPSFHKAFSQVEECSFPTHDGEFVNIDGTGGDEGDGEYVDQIFKLNDRILRVTGTYTSWDGTNWEYGSIEEVFPREVTIIQYTTEKP